MAQPPRAIDLNDVPSIIGGYLKAHQARDIDVAMTSYAPDATVTDEGRTYRGVDAIRGWLSRSASEFTYTVEMIGATMVDENHYDVVHHLEGNFPGGVVDLHFRFELRDGKIGQLVIEP